MTVSGESRNQLKTVSSARLAADETRHAVDELGHFRDLVVGIACWFRTAGGSLRDGDGLRCDFGRAAVVGQIDRDRGVACAAVFSVGVTVTVVPAADAAKLAGSEDEAPTV